MDLTVCLHTIILCQEPGSECVDPMDCELTAHILCTCPLPIKIPKLEVVCFHSQRNKIGELSKYQITGNNSNEIKRLERKMKRQIHEEEAKLKKKRQLEEDLNVQKDINKQWQQQVLQDDVMDIDEEDVIAITKITSEKKNEAENLVYSLLNNRLGEIPPLVLRYLDIVKRNYMSVLNTAKTSMRYNLSPTTTAIFKTT